MLSWCVPQYFWFVAIIAQLSILHTSAIWPVLNASNANIKLLGLFQDPENTSDPTTLSVHSRAMFIAAVILSHQYNMTIGNQYIDWQVVQTGGDSITALRDTCSAVSSSNIVGIVGPTYSRETLLIAPFCGTIGIPVISHCATFPELSDRSIYPAFHRTVPPDNEAAVAIGQLFLQYNWTSAIIIYQNDAFGSGGATAITEVLTDNNITVQKTIIFNIATNSIDGDLNNLITSSSTRIIVLWADITSTGFIFQSALDNNVIGPNYVWISGASIPFDSFNQSSLNNLLGILTVEPVVASVVDAPFNSTLLNAAYDIWQQYKPDTFPGSENVDFYALFAFDATWSLILSLQKLCSSSSNLSTSCTELTNASICFDRRFINSDTLLNTIDNTTFLGVSGPIQFSSNSTDRTVGKYYIAQNAQLTANGLSFVPVLKYSNTDSWSPYNSTTQVIWPGGTLTIPSDRTGLEGVVLRIAVIASTPFTMVSYQKDSNGKLSPTYTGYIPDLIALLQSQMKFVPEIILAPSNRTYADVILDVSNGVYDMLVGDVSITAEWREVVSFSNTIFDDSVSIVMRKTPPDPVVLFAYLTPFTRNLWLLFLGSVIYGGVLLCILERQENEVLKNRSIISLLFMGIWYAIGALIGYGVDFHVRTAAGRLLTAGLYILSIVFVATYTANLASFLTLSLSTEEVTGIDDIKDGKLTFNRIGIPINTPIEDYYLQEVSGGNRNFYPIKSLDQQFTSLIDDVIDATFMDTGLAQYGTNTLYCNLTIIGADFDQSAFGIAMQKDWIYIQDIDVAVLSLTEKGLLDNLRTKWFLQQRCPDDDDDDSSSALGIDDLSGLFLTFAVISVLSVLLFLWIKRKEIREYLLEKAHQKNLLTHINKTTIQRKQPIQQNMD